MQEEIKWEAGLPPPTTQLYWYHLTLANGATVARISDGVKEWRAGERYTRGRPIEWLKVTNHARIYLRRRYERRGKQ